MPMCVTFAVFLYGEAEDSCSVCYITRVAGHHRDGVTVVFGGFPTNQDFIAANLCVNRDRPELECNGKCQLIKTLEEQQPSGQPKGSSCKRPHYTPVSYRLPKRHHWWMKRFANTLP